jgi:hypothetical protein
MFDKMSQLSKNRTVLDAVLCGPGRQPVTGHATAYLRKGPPAENNLQRIERIEEGPRLRETKTPGHRIERLAFGWAVHFPFVICCPNQ